MVFARSSPRSPALAALLAALLVAPLVAPALLPAAAAHARNKRQLADDDTLQPLEVRPSRAGTTSPRQTSSASPTRHPRPRGPRQATASPAQDDIPNFDRNKVSLDFPGNLFGPSVSLLIRTTKVIGDVIQNSAVRYQSFLRLFRPLFRGQFEIKGLDPPTTTTTTTSPTPRPPPPTSTAAGSAEDNEVRRRRHLPLYS